MTVGIGAGDRVVFYVAVQIQGLRDSHLRIRNGHRYRCPVGGHEAHEGVGVVASAEVVEVGLGVALLAGELVLVAGGVGDDDDFAAVGHVVGLGLDSRAGVVGDHVGRV